MTFVTRRVRAVVAAVGLATLASACAVQTPRDGLAANSQVGAVGQPGAVTLPNGEVIVPGSDMPVEAAVDGTGPGVDGTLPDGTTPGAPGAENEAAAAGSEGSAPSAGGAGGAGPAAGPSQGPAPGGGSGNGAGGSTQGVTKSTITVAAIAGFTGSIGPIVEGFYEGYETWAKDVNDRGGINGRKVILKKVDHKDTPEGGVAACKSILDDKDTLFAVILLGPNGSDTSAAGCLDAGGTPVIGIAMSSFRDSWKNVHTLMDMHHQMMAAPTFMKNKLRRGGTKIGVIHGRTTTTMTGKKPFEAEMKRLGMPIIRTEVVADGQSNMVSEMTRMRDAGVETLLLNLGTEVFAALRDARAIGYRPTFVGVNWTIDELSAGGRDLMEGIEGLRVFAGTNTPAYATFREKHQRYGGKVFTSTTAAVYGYGLFTEKILRNAGPNPTQEGLTPAIESITDYNNGYQALSFGKGVKRSQTLQWPIKCCQDDTSWLSTGPPRVRF